MGAHDAGPRVLVAEDDRAVRDSLCRALGLEGYEVQAVPDGLAALDAVASFRPDAIVLDVALPEMSGYAVAQAIRQSFTDLRLPLLIAISGVWRERSDRQVAQQVGFDHYLEKPAESAELLALLESLRALAAR